MKIIKGYHKYNKQWDLIVDFPDIKRGHHVLHVKRYGFYLEIQKGNYSEFKVEDDCQMDGIKNIIKEVKSFLFKIVTITRWKLFLFNCKLAVIQDKLNVH